MNSKIKNIKILGEFVESLSGKHVRISEHITLNADRDFDRHCSITNEFAFEVTKTMWHMSGGHFYLYGKLESLGFFSGALESVEIDDKSACIIEKLETKVLRKVVIEYGASHT